MEAEGFCRAAACEEATFCEGRFFAITFAAAFGACDTAAGVLLAEALPDDAFEREALAVGVLGGKDLARVEGGLRALEAAAVLRDVFSGAERAALFVRGVGFF